MTGPTLTCSANTLRFADLATRVSAAAGAGFTGIGLRVTDILESGKELPAIRDLLDKHGMRTLELEHTWDWADAGSDPVEEIMFAFAATVGVRQLNIPMFYSHPLPKLAQAFAALCDRAADQGVLVGFEFLPYSHVTNLRDGWRIVADADRPNGGLIIDFWHWFRSGAAPGDLEAIPADKVTSIQLCDVASSPHANLAGEARHHRLLPGSGAGDTSTLLAALAAAGVHAPASVEVFSDELDAMAPETAAALAFRAGAETLSRAGMSPAPWLTNLEGARR